MSKSSLNFSLRACSVPGGAKEAAVTFPAAIADKPSAGLDAMGAQSDARGEIRKCAEAGNAENLALEVFHPVDARHGVNPEEKFLDDGRDDHGIGAGEVRLDRGGAA